MKLRKLTCYRCKHRSRQPEEFVHIIPSNKYRCKDLEKCNLRGMRYST